MQLKLISIFIFNFRKENEKDSNQQKYMSFVYDEKLYPDHNAYMQREFDDYDTTDQEDYDYLFTEDESLY